MTREWVYGGALDTKTRLVHFYFQTPNGLSNLQTKVRHGPYRGQDRREASVVSGDLFFIPLRAHVLSVSCLSTILSRFLSFFLLIPFHSHTLIIFLFQILVSWFHWSGVHSFDSAFSFLLHLLSPFDLLLLFLYVYSFLFSSFLSVLTSLPSLPKLSIHLSLLSSFISFFSLHSRIFFDLFFWTFLKDILQGKKRWLLLSRTIIFNNMFPNIKTSALTFALLIMFCLWLPISLSFLC